MFVDFLSAADSLCSLQVGSLLSIALLMRLHSREISCTVFPSLTSWVSTSWNGA